jgi:hypothetical protein
VNDNFVIDCKEFLPAKKIKFEPDQPNWAGILTCKLVLN